MCKVIHIVVCSAEIVKKICIQQFSHNSVRIKNLEAGVVILSNTPVPSLSQSPVFCVTFPEWFIIVLWQVPWRDTLMLTVLRFFF